MTTITKRYGESCTFTATPASGYTFSSWSGDISGSASPRTVTVTGDMTVTANFSQASGISAITVSNIGTASADVTTTWNYPGWGTDYTGYKYGYVYSSTNSTPTVGGSGCTKIELGSWPVNNTYTSTITGLQPGTSYYIRAYFGKADSMRPYIYNNTVQFTTNAPTPSYSGYIDFEDSGASAITDCFDSNWLDNYTVTSLNTMTGARGEIYLNSNVNDFSSTFTYNDYMGSVLDFQRSNIVSIGGYGSASIEAETLILPDTLEDVTVDVLGADICYCFATTPPSLTGPQIQIGVLYVPTGCASDYEDSDWASYAGEIQEMD